MVGILFLSLANREGYTQKFSFFLNLKINKLQLIVCTILSANISNKKDSPVPFGYYYHPGVFADRKCFITQYHRVQNDLQSCKDLNIESVLLPLLWLLAEEIFSFSSKGLYFHSRHAAYKVHLATSGVQFLQPCRPYTNTTVR